MRTKYIALLILSALGFGFYLWKRGKEKPQAREIHTSNQILEITDEQRKGLLIETQIVRETEIISKLELLGETEAVPDQKMDVIARIPGRILKVYFVEGDKVQKGAKLVSIDSPELAKLRSNYQISKSKWKAAEENLNRIQRLVQMNLAAKQELIDAEASFKVVDAEKRASEEYLRANGLALDQSYSGIYTIFAPISGKALTRNAIPGSLVTSDQVFTSIANLDTLWFQAKIFEGDLQFLTEGANAEIFLNSYPEDIFTAKLDHIGEQVDAQSRTVHARLIFKNHNQKAKIGLFGKALIQRQKKRGIVIPKASIQSYQNKTFVLLETEPNKFLWRAVTKGIETAEEVEITDGLREGETIVSKGSFALKAMLFKSTFGGE
ncbi:efflux transporter, RND family, MFP subunit [Leptospira ryugenii]|uniref:Efflux transporter, RND family, MFP subunit n=1 Tax=Leptospira ryugenii TaxID=1917863 RepID=A0A2P2E0C6_9LEPT|nr:efflux RND transporter periplasmic adaptor subunit [Leptospira ryugenii]GBF50330.1 efflux transporter, RND family, MFP subunit [Leptospira ryugenii]